MFSLNIYAYRLYTEMQCPNMPGTSLKVSVGGVGFFKKSEEIELTIPGAMFGGRCN